MANALATKINTFRNSSFLTFIRTLSTSSPSSSDAAASASATTKKSKRRKKKNFFEVAQFLPNWGIGYHMAKTHWQEVSYEITKLNLYKDGKHGKAWGIAYKNGLPLVDAPKKISGVHKRCWRYLPNVVKASESSPTMTSSTDSGLKVENQAS
ncbi:28S ribosomal S34 protein [Trifolium repens]|nr:28S ribosomal S34 protein [Trifolium repens]